MQGTEKKADACRPRGRTRRTDLRPSRRPPVRRMNQSVRKPPTGSRSRPSTAARPCRSRPTGWSARHAVLLLQESRQVGDVEVPAVGLAGVHDAQDPEVPAGHDLEPGHAGRGPPRTRPRWADQGQFGGVDRGFLLRPVAEPEGEQHAPHDAEQPEEPECRPPVHQRRQCQPTVSRAHAVGQRRSLRPAASRPAASARPSAAPTSTPFPGRSPRSCNGNQLCSARVMFGYAPASPMPNRNRTIDQACARPPSMTPPTAHRRSRPVRAVKNDHQSTMRISTLRGPKTSPSQPLGTSNSA